MAKGSNAKIDVENKIRNAFGDRFVGVAEKKLYVLGDEGNGELIQVALSLTCPKVPLSAGGVSEDGLDFDNMPSSGKPTEFKPAEITTEETENIRKMLAELGL